MAVGLGLGLARRSGTREKFFSNRRVNGYLKAMHDTSSACCFEVQLGGSTYRSLSGKGEFLSGPSLEVVDFLMRYITK